MEKLHEEEKRKPIGLCSTPPQAEQSAKDGCKRPPRYYIQITHMWNGKERVLVEKLNHLREIDGIIRYWKRYLHIYSVVIYKRSDL